jgi:hypothetical protein
MQPDACENHREEKPLEDEGAEVDGGAVHGGGVAERGGVHLADPGVEAEREDDQGGVPGGGYAAERVVQG